MPNEIQRFDITGSPGSGNFTLWFNGEGTSPIDYHPAAGDVQDELEALTTPCTLPDLLAFATDILPVTSGSHHDAIVTTTADTITVAWA